jgi:hypothetical protein
MQEVEIAHIKGHIRRDTLHFFYDGVHPNERVIITFHYVCSGHILNLHEGCLGQLRDRMESNKTEVPRLTFSRTRFEKNS